MKRFKRLITSKSLYGQLRRRLFVLLVALLIVVECVQFYATRQYLYHSKVTLLESRIHNVEIASLMNTDTPEILEQNAPDFVAKMVDLNVVISVINSEGKVIAAVNEEQMQEYQQHLLKGDQQLFTQQNDQVPQLSAHMYKDILADSAIHSIHTVQNKSGESFLVMTTKVGSLDYSIGLIQLSTSLKDIQEILLKQFLLFVGIAGVLLIVALILLQLVMRWTLRPLKSMTESIENLSIQELDSRIEQNYGQLEIDQLASAYNGMLNKVEDAFKHEYTMKEKMSRFVSDASHELRTPLTSIHGFAEVLLMGLAKDEKELNRALGSILAESERLSQLVNDLLTLNRLDQKKSTKSCYVDLIKILWDLRPQLEIMMVNRHLEWHIQEAPLMIMADQNQIKQVIINLVQNAVQFTDGTSGVIRIKSEVEQSSQAVLLSISDNGVGISPDVKKHIFNRFYRGQEDRARAVGGYGLGLAIVKSIIEQQGGNIIVKSEMGVGTTFVIKWFVKEQQMENVIKKTEFF